MISLGETASQIILLFMVAALGYLLGHVTIKGIGLGTAAIFLSGLIFGHFGFSLPAVLQSIGLVLFITSVSFDAGPGFLRRLRQNGKSYMILCICTAICGGFVCAALIFFAKLPAPFAVGIMTGAFTTSSAFGAAKEVVASSKELMSMVSAGYGIAYPIGILCKVLFIQLIPRLLQADMDYERSLIDTSPGAAEAAEPAGGIRINQYGLFSFSVVVILGILLGSIHIPLPGGNTFSLGLAGGPLLVGLLFGNLGHFGLLELRCDRSFTQPVKELGLCLFFSGAGLEGGKSVVRIFREYGVRPLIFAFFFVAIPMLFGFLIFRYILKLPLLNGLGAMAASMTCTPSLAVLIQVSKTENVAAAYATTYPIAQVTLLLLVQFLVKL